MSLKESLSNCAGAISNFFRACFCCGEGRNNENNAHERERLIQATASAPAIEIIDLSDADPASASLILRLMDENPARGVSHRHDSEEKHPIDDTANDEFLARTLQEEEESRRRPSRPPARHHHHDAALAANTNANAWLDMNRQLQEAQSVIAQYQNSHSSRTTPSAPPREEKHTTDRPSTKSDNRFPGRGFKMGT